MTSSLWSKAWRESRTRFLVGALLLSAITIVIMRSFGRDAERFGARPDAWYQPLSFMVFGGPPSMVFVILALLLGLGGLQRERALGTAPFTLALPVSRLHLLVVRAVVGFLETAALACLPALLVLALSAQFGPAAYPTMPALRSAVLWAVCGAVWFSAAFLWSAVISTELTATVVCMMTPLGWYTAARYTELKRFPSLDIYGVMVGRTTEWSMPYHDFFTGLMIGPLPWLTLVVFAGVAAGLSAVAVRVTDRQTF